MPRLPTALLLLFLAGCARPKDLRPALADRVGTLLRAHEDELGPVSVQDTVVSLPRSGMRLDLTRAPEKPGLDALHTHVVATTSGAASPRFEVCIIGPGTTDEGRIAAAADEVTRGAFPVMASVLLHGPVPGARQFHGTQAWGVAGRRGYVSSVRMDAVRSISIDPFVTGPIFADAPPLPADGAAHVLKAVIEAKDGAWQRVLAVDARHDDEPGAAWTGAPAPDGRAKVVRYAAFDRVDLVGDAGARTKALEELRAGPAWLSRETGCPADVLPARYVDRGNSNESARGGRLADALRDCEAGSERACYEAAVEVQHEEQGDDHSNPLFFRACRLGSASGCTNVAAGRPKVDGRTDECAWRTFSLVCDRATDPWACSMAAFLAIDEGQYPLDLERLRRQLEGACRFGDDDEACKYAGRLRERIGLK